MSCLSVTILRRKIIWLDTIYQMQPKEQTDPACAGPVWQPLPSKCWVLLSFAPSAVPFCSDGISPKIPVEKEVPHAPAGSRTDSGGIYLKSGWGILKIHSSAAWVAGCWSRSDTQGPLPPHISYSSVWGGFVLFPLNGNVKPCQRLARKDG